MEATAATVREPEFLDILGTARGLNFEGWTKGNRVLNELRRQGLDVEPLARH